MRTFLKKNNAFSLVLAFLPPSRVNPESVKTWVCPKLFYVMMKQM